MAYSAFVYFLETGVATCVVTGDELRFSQIVIISKKADWTFHEKTLLSKKVCYYKQ
jgi:hypothetical protein